MTDPWPAKRVRRGGRYWLLAAVAMPLSPLLFGVALQQDDGWHACAASQRMLVTPTQEPCAPPYSWATVATLSFWTLALAVAATGVLIGVTQGRARGRFAYGRWISMSIVGLCAPWALLAYAIGYGAGRSVPVRRPSAVQHACQGGWQEAVQLYAALSGGRRPPAVFAPDLPAAGTVYMDVPFGYSRFYGMDVTYQPGGMVAIGPPGFVAGATIGRLIGTSIGHVRAASLSRRQWRRHRPTRVVVTDTATWCELGDRWLRFDHDTVMEYRVGADQSCILTFPQVVPLRLHGPSAWCHAVLFAYLRYGRACQSASFLDPIRRSAQQLTNAPR